AVTSSRSRASSSSTSSRRGVARTPLRSSRSDGSRVAAATSTILAAMGMRTVIVLAAGAVLLAGCGGSTTKEAGGKLDVVAAENAYGSIAAQIGGPHVSVTSILTSPSADPHLFEPSTSTGLAVANAKVVIQNGLGYDAFLRRIEEATPDNGGI